ncbi:MAG: DUF362 domain-containing protein [Armatimonadetes bacterium]|nr:DUF362 domain-containing protein [Armatimonadota bacterium]
MEHHMATAEVALVGCEGYESAAGVRRAAAECFRLLGGIGAVVRPGQRVLLKPNLLAAVPAAVPANTHPSVVAAVAELALEAGAEVWIGDSPAFPRLESVCRASGLDQVARRLGVRIVPFRRPVVVPSRAPAVVSAVKVDRAVFEADVVINIPKLKTHRQLGFTAAAKNLYGCMPGKRKAWHHSRIPGDHRFAAFLAAFAATVPASFHLVDAVVAMHRDGPTGGDPLPVGLLVAGCDPFAVDALIARLIHLPDTHDLIGRAARELGPEVTDPERIVVRGLEPGALPEIPFRHAALVGTSFTMPRVLRSAARSFLISRLGRRERR